MTVGFKVFRKVRPDSQLFRALIRQAPSQCGGNNGNLEPSYIRQSIRDPLHKVHVLFNKQRTSTNKLRFTILGFATTREHKNHIYIDVICSKHRRGVEIMNSIIHHKKPIKLGSVTNGTTLRWYARARFTPTNLINSNGLIPHKRDPVGKLRPKYNFRSLKKVSSPARRYPKRLDR